MDHQRIMLTAITRGVSPCLGDCKLSFLPRQQLDIAKATHQHRAYEQCLARLGVRIFSLPVEPELPDAVFVEDPAVVVDEVAVICIIEAKARQPEVSSQKKPAARTLDTTPSLPIARGSICRNSRGLR